MIERTLYTPEHIAFRDSYQRFADKEIAPHHAAWEEQGYVDRAVWEKAGANGFLCMTMPEDCGGAGADRLYAVAQMEVNAAGGYSGIGFGLHNEIVAPYVERYGTAAKKQKSLPAMARGEIIGAIAMSEPAAGSDLQGIKTAAVRQDDGSYLLNGSIGYALQLYRSIYVSPWAGLSLRVAGDSDIRVDGLSFEPRVLNPEASVKFGWVFR